MQTAIVLFTRDLRVHDNPALSAACEAAERVVPLFVFDETILAGPFGVPNRVRFLLDSLADLRRSLKGLGGELVLRRGDPVAQVVRLAGETGAAEVFLADDVSGYARRRRARLERECAQHRLGVSFHPGVTIVPAGAVTPASGDHYKVFTPYWRAWAAHPWRAVLPAPGSLRTPEGLRGDGFPEVPDCPSPELMAGGEAAGRERMRLWLRDSLAGYEDDHDDMAGDETSRLSPYLRFGCVSPLELGTVAKGRTGGTAFARQLAWRDFHHQVTAAFPAIMHRDYRPREQSWHTDAGALEAWREGRTGYPIVDAGMRQLLHEGWMHNRARMIVASFLTRDLRIDWRHGLRHFSYWLADGDVANNAGNWQWTAGTGNDTRPNRVLNPLRQAARFDPRGDYVRRFVPELTKIDAAFVHEPWRLPQALRRELGYPAPIIDPVRSA